MNNTVHFILQGKGGIGKTLVSTLLAQWLRAKGEASLRCFDTDQENPTFSRYKALEVTHIPVMTDARILDQKRFDTLMMEIMDAPGNCVVDNGANTFSPLMAYLIDNDAFALMAESGKQAYVHTIVGGGDTLHDTAAGFVTTASAVSAPLILWENQHFGLLQSASGKQFVDSQTYSDHAHKIKGRVTLAQRNSDTFGADLKKMNIGRLIMDEVLQSEKFNIMEKQRIKTLHRQVFEQLDQIEW